MQLFCIKAIRASEGCAPPVPPRDCGSPDDRAKAVHVARAIGPIPPEDEAFLVAAADHASLALSGEAQKKRVRELQVYQAMPGKECEAISKLRQVIANAKPDQMKVYAEIKSTLAFDRLDPDKPTNDDTGALRAMYLRDFFARRIAARADGALHGRGRRPNLNAIATELECVKDVPDTQAIREAVASEQQQVREAAAAKAAENAKCDADPKCAAARTRADAAQAVCSALVQRAGVLKRIDEEHSYAKQTGVVNLDSLESLKIELHQADEDLQQARDDHPGVLPKTFAIKDCR